MKLALLVKNENIKVFFIVVFCIHLVTLFTGNSTAGAQLDTVCSTALVYEFTDIETTEFTLSYCLDSYHSNI
jgi:hypothetical protein